jgi:hypothetical protein
MKFIPGMRFINRTDNHTKLFKKNKLYILQDIKKLNEDIVRYTFLIDNEIKEIKFESFKQAEDWLQQIIV